MGALVMQSGNLRGVDVKNNGFGEYLGVQWLVWGV